MEQVFIANPKGGCGKTTIATQLASYYAKQHKRVLLVDHDAQKSSSDWLRGRPDSLPKIECVIASVGEKIAFNNADYVVHDMPAAWSLEHVEDIISPQDKVMIPVLSSPNDIKACLHFVMSLHRSGVLESGIDVGMVANRARVHTRYFKVLEEFLQKINLPLIGVLRDTQNYIRSMDFCVSVFDLPEHKVRKDLEQWQALLTWLHTPHYSAAAHM